MPILSRPDLADDLPSYGSLKLYDHSTDKRIFSGDKITLTTDDPHSLPLPSVKLLEMQWVLQRIAAMCGGAEEDDDGFLGDDDDDDYALNVQDQESEEETEEETEAKIPMFSDPAENRPKPKHAEGSANIPPLAIRNPNIQRWGQ